MRTDLTHACPVCAIRFKPSPRCPRCKSELVFDLTLSADRGRLKEELVSHRIGMKLTYRRPGASSLALLLWQRIVPRRIVRFIYKVSEDSSWKAFPVFLFIALFCAPFLVGAVTCWHGWSGEKHSLFADFIASIVVLVCLTPFFALGLAGSLGRFVYMIEGWLNRRFVFIEPMHWPSLEVKTDKASHVFGRVRVDNPMVSPLGKVSCAAYRLTGMGPSSGIDDCAVTSFSIDEQDGNLSLIEPGPATVDIPAIKGPTYRVHSDDGDDPAYAFLRDRGVFLNEGVATVREGVLVDGDQVRVSGSCQEEIAAEGYRTIQVTRRFRDTEQIPLEIRSIKPWTKTKSE